MLKHLGSLTKEVEGVRDHPFEDTEYVHRMRVATRRLRSALPLFASCFPANQIQVWEKEIKRITGTLGEARDRDVQLIILNDTLKTLPDPKPVPGIKRLALRIKQERDTLQKRVVKNLDRFISSGVVEEMMESFREVLGKARVEESPDLSETIFDTALKRGMEGMADVLSYDDFVRDPGNVKQLHALRKSTKKLRYTLEFYNSPYNKGLKTYIDEVKDLQTILGDIHDCDVWIDFLPVFLEDEKRRTLDYFGHTKAMAKTRKGIEYLLKDRKEKRRVLYGNFLNSWNRLLTENFWEKLKTDLRSGLNLLDQSSRENNEGR